MEKGRERNEAINKSGSKAGGKVKTKRKRRKDGNGETEGGF